jgi:hypothetical protein
MKVTNKKKHLINDRPTTSQVMGTVSFHPDCSENNQHTVEILTTVRNPGESENEELITTPC